MFKNNNSRVIKNISTKSIKHNKMRNYFIGIVIVIATFLLTFTMIFAYNNTVNLQNKSNYHVSFENITNKEVKKINENSDISMYGIVKYGGKTKYKDINLNFTYEDENAMKLSNTELIEGTLPKENNEVILEKEYLNSLGVNKGIGDKLLLDYFDEDNSSKKKEFIITGFIATKNTGLKDRKSFESITSKEFVNLNTFSALAQVKDAKKYSNSEIKDKIKKVSEDLGISENNTKINYLNIESNNINPETKYVVIIVGFLVLSSCSIVIYNIFYISIFRKVREYGQLRTIGATKKQIKQIIFREGNILSIKYIPFGMLLGCILTYLMNSFIWVGIPSISLALVSGVIVLLTVRISILKPAKIASNISPIEASVYTGSVKKGNVEITKNRLTPKVLSKIYLKRNKKKAIITFVSLALSGILFITIASVMSSVNIVDRAKQGFPKGGEYIIKLNEEYLSEEYKISDLQKENPLTNELKKKIESVSGIKSVETNKYITAELENVDLEENIIDIIGISNKDNDLKKFLVEGRLPNPSSKGNEILLNKRAIAYESYGLDYKVGDKVELSISDNGKKEKKEFIVSGIIDDKDNGYSFMLNNETMDKIVNINTNYFFEIILNGNDSEEIENSLKNLIKYEDKASFLSLKDEIEVYKAQFSGSITIIYIFTLLIVCFGIVNLINTIITNILTRKNEFSIMQALGLTSNQLTKMINTENMYIIFGSILVSILGGGLLGYRLCKVIENMGGLSYVQYKFPLLLILIYIGVAFLIQILISKFVGKSIRSKSLVERLKDI